MANITKKIWDYISSDPVLKKAISRKIINKRSLAQYLKKELKMDVPLNAIISAIRRYKSQNYDDVYAKAMNVMKKSTLSSKNGIVSLTLEKDVVIERIIPDLFSLIQTKKNDVFRIIQADQGIKLIIDKYNLDKAKKIIPNDKIINITQDLAEVTLHLNKISWTTPGITSILTAQLSINDINIMEIMSCIPEIIIFFKEKDLMQAYNVLYGLTR